MAKYVNEVHQHINTTLNISGKEEIAKLKKELEASQKTEVALRQEIERLNNELEDTKRSLEETSEELKKLKMDTAVKELEELHRLKLY